MEPKEFDEYFYYNTRVINVKGDQSRHAISIPEAYKNAIYWEIDDLHPAVFTMAGAWNPNPTLMTRKNPSASSVPPDSATAKAKKARIGEGESTTTPKPKPRAKSIMPTRLA